MVSTSSELVGLDPDTVTNAAMKFYEMPQDYDVQEAIYWAIILDEWKKEKLLQSLIKIWDTIDDKHNIMDLYCEFLDLAFKTGNKEAYDIIAAYGRKHDRN